MAKSGRGYARASAEEFQQAVGRQNDTQRLDGPTVLFGNGPSADLAEAHAHLAGALHPRFDGAPEGSPEFGAFRQCGVTDPQVVEIISIAFVEIPQAGDHA